MSLEAKYQDLLKAYVELQKRCSAQSSMINKFMRELEENLSDVYLDYEPLSEDIQEDIYSTSSDLNFQFGELT